MLGDGIPSADYLRTKQDPTWGKYVYDASEIANYYVFMNVNEKPFTDVKVRQAVNYAINTVRIQKLLAGQAKALNQVYPGGHARPSDPTRSSTPTTRRRRSSCSPRPGSPTASR